MFEDQQTQDCFKQKLVDLALYASSHRISGRIMQGSNFKEIFLRTRIKDDSHACAYISYTRALSPLSDHFSEN